MKSMNDVRAFLDRKIAANVFPGIQYLMLNREGGCIRLRCGKCVASIVIANDTSFDAPGLLNEVDVVGT